MSLKKLRVRINAEWVDTGEIWVGEIETYGMSHLDAAQRFINLVNYIQMKRRQGEGKYRKIIAIDALSLRNP